MRVVYKKPILDKIQDEIEAAKRNNIEIEKVILNGDELHELRNRIEESGITFFRDIRRGTEFCHLWGIQVERGLD